MANPNTKPEGTPQPNKNQGSPGKVNEFPEQQPTENPNQRDSRDAEAGQIKPPK